MAKSPSEQIAGFLLDFLPSLLPKPVDAVAKSAIGSFRGQLDNYLKQPRLHRELLDATQKSESNFRFEARRQLKSDELIQAVSSFPLFDNDLFQKALASLPEHLDEEFLAHDLKKLIDDDWKGKFTPVELREGVAIYLNCLRIQLLNVEGFGDIVTKLATLRTDMRTERIDERTARIESKIDFISEIIQPQTAYSQAVKIDPTVPRTLPDFYVSRDELLKQIKTALGMDVGMGGALLLSPRYSVLEVLERQYWHKQLQMTQIYKPHFQTDYYGLRLDLTHETLNLPTHASAIGLLLYISTRDSFPIQPVKRKRCEDN